MITGSDLRAARKGADQRMSLGMIAAYAGVTPGHLSRVERGDREPTYQIVAAYEAALGRKIAATPAPGSSSTVDDMNRRSVIGVIAAASVGGASLIEPLTHLLNGLPAPAPPTNVGLSEVQAVEQACDLYTKIDLQYGGGLAAEIGRGSLSWAVALLGQTSTDATKDRLRAAVGALTDRIAWSWYDTGAHTSAHGLFVQALNTAAKSNDRDLRAHILLNYSTLCFDAGRAPEALEVLRLALGDERITSTERANLHAVAARHSGSVGDTDTARRHYQLAEQALADANPTAAPKSWARLVTGQPGHFDSALGLAAHAIGDHEATRTRFTAALAALPANGRARTRVRCLTRLAAVDLADGNTAQGESHARAARAAAIGLRSARIRTDLAMVATAAETVGLHELAADLSMPSDAAA